MSPSNKIPSDDELDIIRAEGEGMPEPVNNKGEVNDYKENGCKELPPED